MTPDLMAMYGGWGSTDVVLLPSIEFGHEMGS